MARFANGNQPHVGEMSCGLLPIHPIFVRCRHHKGRSAGWEQLGSQWELQIQALDVPHAIACSYKTPGPYGVSYETGS